MQQTELPSGLRASCSCTITSCEAATQPTRLRQDSLAIHNSGPCQPPAHAQQMASGPVGPEHGQEPTHKLL